MRSKRDFAQALYVAALALGRTRDPGEVVQAATTEMQRAVGAEAVALYLLDSGRQRLMLREAVGPTPGPWEQIARLPLSDALLEAGALREQRVVASRVDEHPCPMLRSILTEQGFRYVTALPVAGREQALGLLYLASRGELPVVGEEETLLRAIGGLIGVALENAALREATQDQQERLRALADGVLHSREEEARRIAHELHDEAGQLLASLHIAVDELVKKMPAQADAFRNLHERLEQVEAQLRRISRELRPTILDDLGLAPALDWLAEGVGQRTGLAITVEASVRRLAQPVETAIYRIVQEALANVARHAGATTVQVQVRDEGVGVRAIVRDDGRGFDVETAMARRGDRGLGLIGMHERIRALGGEFSIESSPGRGTRLSVAIPTGEAA